MNDRLELDIPVLLPEIPDVADACVHRLISTLAVTPGIMKAHGGNARVESPAADQRGTRIVLSFPREKGT